MPADRTRISDTNHGKKPWPMLWADIKTGWYPVLLPISVLIIHQLFSIARYWSKLITWLNMFQLKPRNIRVIFPNFQKSVLVAKNIWRVIKKKKQSFMLLYLSLDIIIWSSKLTVFLGALGKLFACRTDNVHRHDRAWPSIFSFLMHGSYCLFTDPNNSLFYQIRLWERVRYVATL